MLVQWYHKESEVRNWTNNGKNEKIYRAWTSCQGIKRPHAARNLYSLYSHRIPRLIHLLTSTLSIELSYTPVMDYSTTDAETLQAMAALFAKMTRVQTAHAVLMSLAVVFWFPLGVILLRLLKVKNTVRWHAIWQSFGLVLLIAGFGLGIWISKKAGVCLNPFRPRAFE